MVGGTTMVGRAFRWHLQGRDVSMGNGSIAVEGMGSRLAA